MAKPVIRQRVRTAFRALALARGVECALIGSGTLLVLLAVLAWEGALLGSFSPWAVAVGCGGFAAATWWLEHNPRPDGVARRLDKRLGLDGMVFTAWEVERQEDELGGLLSERVASRVPRRRALDAVLPASAPLLVLPFLGAGMLAFALDVREAEEDPGQRTLEYTRSARGHLAEATALEELPSELIEELQALGEASEALLEGLEAEPSAAEGPAFDELLEEIGRLREEVPAGEETFRALDRAEELLEAARLALAGAEGSPELGGSGAGSQDTEGGGSGHSDAQGGTISGLDPRDLTAETPALAGEEWRGPEGALGPGTYWPEEHRGVVSRWIEQTRARARDRDD